MLVFGGMQALHSEAERSEEGGVGERERREKERSECGRCEREWSRCATGYLGTVRRLKLELERWGLELRGPRGEDTGEKTRAKTRR